MLAACYINSGPVFPCTGLGPHCGYFIYVCNLRCGLRLKHFQFSRRVPSQATRHKKHAHDKYTRIQPFTSVQEMSGPLAGAGSVYLAFYSCALFVSAHYNQLLFCFSIGTSPRPQLFSHVPMVLAGAGGGIKM